ncbi:hypothetical protein L228DRAFT_282169 [Xylona heveae TC161]|uniref:Uncharacterized protein n=1 Tax=Xylona heveae (strain CBS 132557 / TC161) TaxID=1328760 RepID=A0A165HFM2_XYLHT|nr:hypothetical protein L228DRAFT_282169 [Xylona heveae TC161]KZF23440.1 hypothetical protein L228DRAFT_282169 [Xylona heveae TC161]
MEYVKGERCGVENCRSNRYYVEDGLWFCRNGHRKEGRIQVEEDEDAFGTQGKKTRKKREARELESKVYRGPRAFHLYLQAYQFILRKQVHCLVHQKGLPAELEFVVRDLWALRLQSFKSKAEDISDTDGQSLVFSSQAEDTDASEVDSRKSRGRRSGYHAPTMIETLALCYIGTLMLRLPVSVGDFIRWAKREEIVYFRAVRWVPMAVKSRLRGQWLEALDSVATLRAEHLQQAVLRLISLFTTTFDIAMPPLNHSLLLFSYIKGLALPLDLYPAVLRLAETAGVSFTFRPSSGLLTVLPEVQLISLLIMAVKLCQPLDSIPRYPQSQVEPATLLVDWATWAAASRDPNVSESAVHGTTKERQSEIKEEDVFKMTEYDIDDYLGWFEQTWVEKGEHKLPQQLLEMFPTDPSAKLADKPSSTQSFNSPLSSREDGIKRIQETLACQQIVPGVSQNNVNRPGSYYKHFRRGEDMSSTAKRLFQAASDLIGVSIETLVKSVFALECKFQNWNHEEKRKEVASLFRPASPDDMNQQL